MLNDTQDVDSAEDLYLKNEVLYNYLYGDIGWKIILFATIFLIFIVGPILMFGIVIFEIFGGDSQKRTILNRLLSGFLINMAIFGIMIGVSRIVRDCYGLVDSRLGLFIMVSRMIVKIASYMFFFCLTIWRYLFIVVWKRMRGVQDNFFSTFISLSIYTFSAWLTMAKIIIGFHPNQVLFIYLSEKPMANSTTKDEEYVVTIMLKIRGLIISLISNHGFILT